MVTWEAARIKRCYREFIQQKCVKNGNEELNADAKIFDETQLDEEKMESRILDLVAALGVVRERRRQAKRKRWTSSGQPMSPEMETSLNNVFKTTVISFLEAVVVNNGTEVPGHDGAVELVMRAFPDTSKLIDGRGWLPLHWAAVTAATEEKEQIEKETNMKELYAIDPMALQRHHLEGTALDNMGYTPAHLLCMRETTNRSMTLIKHLSICNEQAFTMSASYPNRGHGSLYSYSALHAACGSGQPTEELLQHLLQLDSSQTKKKCSGKGLTPLGCLCKNDACSEKLVSCLLDVDSSAEVVGIVIVGCFQFADCSRVLERVEMLLKANPENAKYRNSSEMNLLHMAIRSRNLPFQLRISIMQRILAMHKNAVREVCSSGWLPLHYAASHGTVEMLEFLLGLYPESASVVTTAPENLLHLAVNDNKSTTSVILAKVRFLCSRYPAMMLQRDHEGDTPLHVAICNKNIPAVQILCEAGGQEQIRLPVAHPTDDDCNWKGWLPLHFYANWNAGSLRGSPLSKAADCFRMLLRLHPEAAGIEGGVGVRYTKTPYQLAVDNNLPPYYLRLLLRAAPDLHPAALHRLNYAERRMAMFLTFKAVTSTGGLTLLAKLLRDSSGTLHDIMSFL